MALFYGQAVAQAILDRTQKLIVRENLTPSLAVILVGNDPASHRYVTFKEEAARKIGVRLEKFLLPETAQADEIIDLIEQQNSRPEVHGIIVQLPLPKSLPTDDIISHITPEKDTDGFHPDTLKKFLSGDMSACPVFPGAVIELLQAMESDYTGKKGLVLANSELLGSVMQKALEQIGVGAEVILSSVPKEVISEKMQNADVIVTACGMKDYITADMVKDTAIIVDGGITEIENGKVRGDVNRESVMEKAKYLTPVPGGVGPVTVAMLLSRVTEAAHRQKM